MLAGNAKRIFCDNVTCFGTNESCWNRSHLSEFFMELLKHAQLACHCAGWHSATLVLDETTGHLLICPTHLPWIFLNTTQSCVFPLHSAALTWSTSLLTAPMSGCRATMGKIPEYCPIVRISAAFGSIDVVYELTEAPMSWATLLPLQLKLKSLEGDSRWSE